MRIQRLKPLAIGACFAVLYWLAALSGYAQVDVTGALVGNGSYTTLTAAFTAINGGAQGGATIVVTITGNTNEGTASATLNQSAAPWASLMIQPSGGPWTITGVTPNPLINLNGADNVTIDGANALSFSNTSNSSSNGTSTIRFIGDASNNVVTRCTILSSSGALATGSGGAVLFSTGTTTGNDNNTISFCNIGPAGGGLPRVCITGNGSNSSVPVYNSGNQILNCNIFDYFVSNAVSSGIYSNSGNRAWTISNNRFYQTTNRSINNVHTAIQFNGAAGNDGSLISGNIIGFANSTGTGTYTIFGTGSSARFMPIYIANASTTSANSIQGNTIQNILFSGPMTGTGTSAPFAGIFVDNGLANIGTVTGNVIGSNTASGSITFSSNATSACDVYGIHYSVLATTTIANNQISGITLYQSGNNSVAFYGIRATGSASGILTVQGNSIGAAMGPIDNNAVGSSSKSIGILVETGNANILSNTVRNLTVMGDNVGIGTLASMTGILCDNPTATSASTIDHNSVTACDQLSAAAAVSVNGICFSGSSGPLHQVQFNAVHSLTASNASSSVNGIYVGAGNAQFHNNMIRLGYDAGGGSVSWGMNIAGIQVPNGGSNLYHNTVYIGGTNVSGSNRTYAFGTMMGSSPTRIQNNIFHNARSNDVSGTGKHHAISIGGNLLNLPGITSDYNDLYVSGSGGAVGYFSPGVDHATLSSWQAATGRDTYSFSQDPNLLNPTGSAATVDLHIGGPTPVEGVGTAVALVTLDYDGQLRSGLTPVDVGADAGNFTFIDQSPPTIVYASGANCTVGDFTFTANILDDTGVPTTGALQPRVYYRKNNGPFQSAQGVLSSGTAQNGTWTFTILASSMGGMVLGDFVQYFVVAQDVVGPYLISNPGTGLVASDVNNVTTPPSTLHKYGAMGGTYTVGVGGNYTTLTAAVADYNASCLGGPVLFSLIDASYPSETFPITINVSPYANSTNTLTIKPAAGISPTISGNNVLFLLNGADYVTIDGSNGTVVNSICPRDTATRNLTLQTTGSAAAQVAISTTPGNNPATNNRIMNCKLTGVGISIHIGGPTVGSGTGANGNHYNEIVNNLLDNDLFASGASVQKSQFNTYSLNRMKGKMTLLYENAPTIHANTLGGRTATSGDVLGMNLGFHTGAITNSSTTGQEVTNASIQYNRVDLLESQSRESVCGICIAATSTGTTTVANNMVSRIGSDPITPDFGAGIFWGGGAGTLRVWYNTVSVKNPTGTFLTSTEPMVALGINGVTPVSDIRNNILHGNVPFNANTTSINLGYSSTLGNYLNLSSNYNDLTTTGQSGSCTGRTVSLSSSGTSYPTLANWQFATGRDGNSIRVLPNFVSASDLHLPDLSNPNIVDRGTPILITTDFDCESRSLTTPDMGADETVHDCTTAEAGVINGNTSFFCGSGSLSLTATGFQAGAGAGANFVWQSSPAGLNTWTNTGGTNPAGFISAPLTSSTDFRLWTSCATNSSVDSSNVFTVTVSPVTNPGVSIVVNPDSTICPGSTATFTATATNAGSLPTYQWQLNGSNVGTNSPTYVNSTLATGNQISCVVTSNDPCASPTNVTSNTITMTVGDATAPTAVCQNLTVALDILGSGSISGSVANNGSFDNCTTQGSLAFSIPNAAFTCSDIGSNLRTLTVTDASGNTGTCGLTVTVVDLLPPTAICQNLTVALDGSGNASITPTQVNNASADNCTPPNALSLSLSGSSFTCSQAGSNQRTLTVTDAQGNASTCTAAIQVIDNLPPLATCQSITVGLNGAGFAGVAAASILSSGTDNCTSSPDLVLNLSPTDFICSNLGNNAVTLTVTDQHGNTTSCTATVTITDPVAPLAQCQNVTLALDAQGSASLNTTQVDNGSVDNCSATLSLSATAFGCGDVGNNLVTLTVTDGSSNTASCNAIVAVADTFAPTALCQNLSLSLGPNGTVSISAGAVDAGSSDACGIAQMTLDQSLFDCGDLGANPVLLTVTDSSGNASTCSATVTLSGATLSGFASVTPMDCGFDISCAGVSDGSATASAAGGCPPYSYSWSNGGSTPTITGLAAGTYTVTITDGGGAILTDTVTLTEPPALQASVVSVQPSCAGNPTGGADIQPTGGNSCHLYSYLWSNGDTLQDLSAAPLGSYMLIVTDAQGCSAIQAVTIGTVPAPVPTFTQVGHQLISGQTWATYQWLLNGIPLSGADASIYDILVQGTYTLQVTDSNGCIGTSSPLVVVGIEEALGGWALYPNPARDRCHLSTNQPATEGTKVRLTDVLGRVMMEQAFPVSETKMEMDLRGYAAGIYWLEISTLDGGRKAFRLVVE